LLTPYKELTIMQNKEVVGTTRPSNLSPGASRATGLDDSDVELTPLDSGDERLPVITYALVPDFLLS
jgi:hypothetical protein